MRFRYVPVRHVCALQANTRRKIGTLERRRHGPRLGRMRRAHPRRILLSAALLWVAAGCSQKAAGRGTQYAGTLGVMAGAGSLADTSCYHMKSDDPTTEERFSTCVSNSGTRPEVAPAVLAAGAAAVAAGYAIEKSADEDIHKKTSSPMLTVRVPGDPLPEVPVELSSIDRRVQSLVVDELRALEAQWKAEASAILVLDPKTGEILGSAGRAHGELASVGIESPYVTGSTLKPLVLAAALEARVLSPADRFDCENGKRTYPSGETLLDASANGELDVADMLAVSTNVGFSKVFDRLGSARLLAALKRFQLGAAPELPGAGSGTLPSSVADKSYLGGVLAAGELATATLLQMTAAYGVFANQGDYVAPRLTRATRKAPPIHVVSPGTATTVLRMLIHAVESPRATGKAARVSGTRVAGKTGTSTFERADRSEGAFASFIGMVPAENPRWVIGVGAELKQDSAGGGTGGTLSAPVFARVAAGLLAMAPTRPGN